VDDCIEAGRLESMKLFVFQIDVVNYFGEILQAANVRQAKTLSHRFEGAVVALMRKLRAEHVERNRALDRLFLIHEIETRPLINELRNQPRGGESIDMQVLSGYPTSILIVRDG